MTILEYLRTVSESADGATTMVAMQNVTEFVLIPKSDVTIDIMSTVIDADLNTNIIDADLINDTHNAILTTDKLDANIEQNIYEVTYYE